MDMMSATDRTELWVPFLRRLTEDFPRWAIWKNVASAFAGTGDVDSLAPSSDWPGIQQAFQQWAGELGMGPVVVCRHIPQGPHFVTFQKDSPYLVHLDVVDRATFRGSTLIDVESLLPLSETDEHGIRRVRPGVEGVIKLCSNGIRKGGRPNWEGLKTKNVVGLLEADPEGLQEGAKLLGYAESALLAGAKALMVGGWDRRAMITVEAWALARSVAEPRVSASRLVRYLRVATNRCPLIELVRDHDRIVPDDRDAFLRALAPNHETYPASVPL